VTIIALKHVVIKGVSIHISTFLSLYLGDVGCHTQSLVRKCFCFDKMITSHSTEFPVFFVDLCQLDQSH
jgi:hypothetical protein